MKRERVGVTCGVPGPPPDAKIQALDGLEWGTQTDGRKFRGRKSKRNV